MSVSIESWIAARRPPAAMPLDRWMDPGSGEPVGVLTGMAAAALRSALALPSREREGAYHLLAADALFTYACEAALESEDVEGALLGILGSASQR